MKQNILQLTGGSMSGRGPEMSGNFFGEMDAEEKEKRKPVQYIPNEPVDSTLSTYDQEKIKDGIDEDRPPLTNEEIMEQRRKKALNRAAKPWFDHWEEHKRDRDKLKL